MDFDLLNAVSLLETSNGIVAIPGPEGYGLASRPDRTETLERIQRITGSDSTMLLLGRDINAFTPYVETIPKPAFDLMTRHWPGLLIMQLPKASLVPANVCREAFVSLIQPEAPLLLDLLSLIPGGLLAISSSGRMGDVSPKTAQAVFDMFGDDVDYVLQQDDAVPQSEVATVVSIDQDGEIHLLRSGRIVLD